MRTWSRKNLKNEIDVDTLFASSGEMIQATLRQSSLQAAQARGIPRIDKTHRLFNLESIAAAMGIGSTTMEPTGVKSFYDISATKGDGSSIDMNDFKGKVVYATNVASK